MTKPLLTFDLRSKLLTVLLANLILFFPVSFTFEAYFISFIYGLFILNGGLKKGTIFYLIFWLFTLGYFFLLPMLQASFLAPLSFLFFATKRFFPIIMTGAFTMNNMKISECMATLKKCHLPFEIIVPLTVLFRFFPTIMADLRNIRNVMKYRGIAYSTFDLVLHPFKSLEYLIIPILLATENNALDLSSSALVRGLNNLHAYTSIYEIKLKRQDYLLMVSTSALFLYGVILK